MTDSIKFHKNPNKSLEGTKVIEIFTQAQPSDAFAAYIDSMKVIPFGYMGMEIIDTIVAKGAAGKGDGLEEAIAQIEKIETNYKSLLITYFIT